MSTTSSAKLRSSSKPKDQGWGRGRRPVIKVFWSNARKYCAWLSEQTGRAYRLPSEAEWEYACRAGTETPFHFGARLTADQANFYGNSTYNGSAKGEYRKRTVPVGSFPPNAFGLYDMHGNVWEWCQDAWHGQVRRRSERRHGLGKRGIRVQCAARRVLVQRTEELPRRLPHLLARLPRRRWVSRMSFGPHRIAGRCAADHSIAAALHTERRGAARAFFCVSRDRS